MRAPKMGSFTASELFYCEVQPAKKSCSSRLGGKEEAKGAAQALGVGDVEARRSHRLVRVANHGGA